VTTLPPWCSGARHARPPPPGGSTVRDGTTVVRDGRSLPHTERKCGNVDVDKLTYTTLSINMQNNVLLYYENLFIIIIIL
jgi:hypothetical protein